jgi:transcriptional regulator with GAF, ATPase, and Fis domain
LLCLLFEAGRAHPKSWSLSGIEAVGVGRGAKVDEPELPHRLDVRLVDRKLSSLHFQVRRTAEGWLLEDAASRNGTRVDGATTQQCILRGGEFIEAGRSLFFFLSEGVVAASKGLLTHHAGFATALTELEAVAPSALPVLLLGETGTGKEVLAREVHARSGRTGPILAVNCGALPRALIEAELFGFRKGTFSGATEDRPGLVRSADQGTLFLDEVGDLPLDAQGVLLRVLQEGEVTPVGGVRPVKVDERVVAATHKDLPDLVRRGQFRADLLARLSGFTVRLPPLRHRRADLGQLTAELLLRHVPSRAHAVEFTPDAQRLIATWQWPENVRELEKALMAAVLLAGEGPVDVEHLRRETSAPTTESVNPGASLREALVRHRGNLTQVARELCTSRAQLHRLCQRYGLNPNDFRGHRTFS